MNITPHPIFRFPRRIKVQRLNPWGSKFKVSSPQSNLLVLGVHFTGTKVWNSLTQLQHSSVSVTWFLMPGKHCDCFCSYKGLSQAKFLMLPSRVSPKRLSENWLHPLTKFRKQASLQDPKPVISGKDLFPEPRENPVYSVLPNIFVGIRDIRVRKDRWQKLWFLPDQDASHSKLGT